MIDTIASPYIHAANENSFQTLVLENSNAGPALVNFWEKKAGPCLRQYPILDALIAQYQGEFLLVNVDTAKEIKISRQYGITSVPTLKLFRDQKIQETLHGYQSEADLMKILDQYVVRDSDQKLTTAIKEYAVSNRNEAYEIITSAIIDDPANSRLLVALCKLLKHEQRYTEAANLLQSVPPEISENADIVLLQDQLSFLIVADQITDIDALHKHEQEFTNDLDTKMKLCSYYAAKNNFKVALQELSNIIEIDPQYNEHYARKAMLRIFNILGKGHELATEFRPLLKQSDTLH